MTQTLTLGMDEKAVISLAPKTASDDAAQLDALPTYTSDNPAVVTVNRDFYAPKTATVMTVAPGTAVITISAVSEGTTLTDTINLTVVSRKAVTLGTTLSVSKK